MIITKTPFRISFFGGGTDYPDWYLQNGGSVLATTIDKYCYISLRKLPPFFDHKHRVVYSKVENVLRTSDIKHPSIRNVMEWMNIEEGQEIHHDGDLPARSGLGSSSSFTVGLINAFTAQQGKRMSKKTLAESAIHVEQKIICENVGSQDQISASYGGINRIDFLKNGNFNVIPQLTKQTRLKELNDHLMLFFTGVTRIASSVASDKIKNLNKRCDELNALKDMVDEAEAILNDDNRSILEFGELLNEAWMYKRSLSSKVSNEHIDTIYESAKDAGAIGGKILGAGGGGFFLAFVEPKKQPRVSKALSKLVHVPFNFENSGSSVVVYEPQGL